MATEKAVRFIRTHLQEAIAAEKSFETQLRGFAGEGSSDQIRGLFLQHADETRTQYERLTRRLTELGGDPAASTSFLAHLVGLSPKLAQVGHDTVDRVTQNLMMAYAVENCEIAMYETLIAITEAAGDEDTAEMARAIQEEERRTAEKVWKLISPWAGTAFKKLASAEQLTA
jgi:ferritin-like metal-binding protein YciE